MKVLAWAWSAFVAFVLLGSLIDGLFGPALLFAAVLAITLPIKALRDRIASYGLKGKNLGAAIVVLSLVSFGFLGASLPDTPEAQAQRAEQERKKTADAAAEEAAEAAEERAEADKKRRQEQQKVAEATEERRKGFHCLSGWDGSHRGVVTALKENLRNPDSFEHAETRLTPVNDKGSHLLIMKYRAENGFGGMNVESATAVVKNSDCSFEIVTAG